MEIKKKNIHMNKIIKTESVSFYLNKEERVPEGSPDISSILIQKEMVVPDSVSIRNEQVVMNGNLSYDILYYSDDGEKVYGIEGEIPFEEMAKIVGLKEGCKADVEMTVLNSSVKPVDSRSYIYKVQILAFITLEKIEDIETVIEADRENMMVKTGEIESTSLVSDRKDTFRINEQISIPSGKPAINKIVWKDVKIKKINTKMMEGMIHVGGEMYVFVMYIPEDENAPQQWIETVINFGGTVDMEEATEDMISYIRADLHNLNIDAVLDQDNENRNLDISAMLRISTKLYQESQMDIVEDVYAPDADMEPVATQQTYEKLLIKNMARTKTAVKMKIDQTKGHILQICNSSAELKIDNITVCDNGLKVSGKIKTKVMYMAADDTRPICCQSKESDFEHRIDAEGISPQDRYYINWRVEQVNGNMLSTEEVEVKAVVALEAIVFKEINKDFISDITERPMDTEAINNAPQLKGYVVQSGDTLWKLAKENYTTIDMIKKINDLKDEQVKAGDRIIIMKMPVY